MKTRDWQKLLTAQAREGKTLFVPTELANASGVPRRLLNVELSRLVKYGVLARFAQGLYGLPGQRVSPERLLGNLDPHAYITGHYALLRQGFVTQAPAAATCFTARRHFRRVIVTPAGKLEFVTVRPPVYRRDDRGLAGPEQALCDWVYLALRRGHDPVGLLTFRRLSGFRPAVLARLLRHYPGTVARTVQRIMLEGRRSEP